jgi:DNA-binding transcriptional LysR family regulator
VHFKRLDLNLLVALDALLKEGSVTRAAQQLHVSQPAMSSALQRLREHFGDPLLVRVGRSMELTPRAKSLAQPVRDILLFVDSTVRSEPVFDPATARRTFTIAMTDFISVVLMPGVIRRLVAEAPGIKLVMHPMSQSITQELEAGDVDLAIRAIVKPYETEMNPPHLHSQFLLSTPWVCAVGKDHPTIREQLTIDDYTGNPHVSLRIGHGVLTLEQISMIQMSLDVDVVATSSSFVTQLMMLRGTPLIALMPERLASALAQYLPVRTFPPPFELSPLDEAMVWHTRDDQDACSKWLRRLITEVAESA